MTYRNTHILDIIEQATEHYSGYDQRRGNYKETSLDRWKFAELLIRECTKMVSSPDDINRINQHFGVKE